MLLPFTGGLKKVIIKITEALANQPRVGRPVDGLEPEFRGWPNDFGDSGYLLL